MERYAQLSGNTVNMVIESETDPDGINGEWIACDATVGPGWTYDGQLFRPPVIVPKPDPEWLWYIDIGPFLDRFGAAKIPLLADSNATVKAIVTDCLSRKWVDLKRPDVALAIDALINLGHNVDKAVILDSAVTSAENLALRKLFFS